jgi:hypothetical protein
MHDTSDGAAVKPEEDALVNNSSQADPDLS